MKTLIWILIILVVLGGIGSAVGYKINALIQASKIPTYRTAKVTRADILATISATGTLQPEESIDVGAQVAGRIVAFGKDTNGYEVNNNSEVKAGDLLAKIDDVTYVADVNQAQAQIAQDNATIEKAVADLGVAQSKLDQANRDFNRIKDLGSDVLARETYDSYLSAKETAQAQIPSQQAAIAEAKAALQRDQANLDRAQRNVGYCTIVAPADGVIIDRRVNIGQTVVSSLNSPSLFLLARDLTHMWINVAVNEADISLVAEGQTVMFTVDARPDETFRGIVRKKRLFGQNTQNVITYPVEITADNPHRKLIPYQTANCRFEIGHRENVLTVPVAALSWAPPTEHISADVRDEAEKMIKAVDESKPGHLVTRHQTATTHPATEPAATESDSSVSRLDRLYPGILWIKDPKNPNFVRPFSVQTGLSDGYYTQVQSDQINEGTEIVTSEEPKTGWGAPKK